MKKTITFLLLLFSIGAVAQVLPTPTGAAVKDQAVTLGMKFKPKSSGTAVGLMYYRNFTGAVTGQLWSSTGALLASVSFSDNTAGWKTGIFPAAVQILQGAEYTVSYFSAGGSYYATQGYFPKSFANYDATGSAYKYGATAQFPNLTFNASNYFVEPILTYTTAPPQPPTKPDTVIKYITIHDTVPVEVQITKEVWRTDTLFLKDTLAYERNSMYSDSALNKLRFDDGIYNFEFQLGAKKIRFIRQMVWAKQEYIDGQWIDQ